MIDCVLRQMHLPFG